jgi:hypothetical protein
MQCSKRPVNLGAFGQAIGFLTNYNLAPADEKDPRMTALRRRGKLCYGSFLKIHPAVSVGHPAASSRHWR